MAVFWFIQPPPFPQGKLNRTTPRMGEKKPGNKKKARQEAGIRFEDTQYLAGHSNPKTTQIYDRRRRRVTRNIVERIAV